MIKKFDNPEYVEMMCKLRIRRKVLGVSLKELSEALGISRSALSQFESLKATLSDGIIREYIKYLDKKEGR